MKEFPLFVGIDVSGDCLDVAVRPTGEALQVFHDSQGISGLVERLGQDAGELGIESYPEFVLMPEMDDED